MTEMGGKVVLVSGGMGGVGSAVAGLLIQNGYRVALLYRNSSECAVSEKRTELGECSFFVRCDMNDIEEIRRATDDVLAHFGHIDICIHAAVGAITRKRIVDMTESEFRGAFEADFFGARALFSTVVPNMKARHAGMLIGITSSAIEEGGGGARMGAYIAAKYALRGLLRELHRELSPEGISVYAVAPDLLKTALTSDLPEKYFEFAEANTPSKKLMTPLAVAEVLLEICQGSVPPGTSLLVSTHETTSL